MSDATEFTEFVVLGDSRLDQINIDFLRNKKIIAINKVPLLTYNTEVFNLIHHWITWDCSNFDVIQVLPANITPWLRSSIELREKMHDCPHETGMQWYEDAGGHTAHIRTIDPTIPYVTTPLASCQNLKLNNNSSIVETACHLAWNLGATKIFLVSTDLDEECKHLYTPALHKLNDALTSLNTAIPVYRTIGSSSLNLPLYRGKVYKKEMRL